MGFATRIVAQTNLTPQTSPLTRSLGLSHQQQRETHPALLRARPEYDPAIPCLTLDSSQLTLPPSLPPKNNYAMKLFRNARNLACVSLREHAVIRLLLLALFLPALSQAGERTFGNGTLTEYLSIYDVDNSGVLSPTEFNQITAVSLRSNLPASHPQLPAL
jgi:hypothetical protein